MKIWTLHVTQLMALKHLCAMQSLPVGQLAEEALRQAS